MKPLASLSAAGLGLLLLLSVTPARSGTMTRDQVIAEGGKMADAQLAVFNKKGKYPWPFWDVAVFWAGFADFSKVSPNPACHDILLRSGDRMKWTPPLYQKNSPNSADDMCIGQAWLEVYEQTQNPEILARIRERIDAATAFMEASADLKNWTWCDALFMAPPVHARLSAITGDSKYLQAMHEEWTRNSAALYDPGEHLYFRDRMKMKQKTRNGQKTFWARGNGWVLGGLARTLEYIPKENPVREGYVTQLKDIATRLASLQRPDGTWSPSLLDYDEFPFSETSGTALNCFAMAWGINHGILDEKTFRPVVEKAWAALLAARRPDGLLGYVQGVAHGPGPVYADRTQTYATGAFLMAAVQLARLAPLTLPEAPQLTAAAATEPSK